MQDMHQIIKLIKKEQEGNFYYLSPAVPKSSVDYHYYNLK